MKILVVNAGSSSHKLSYYDLHGEEHQESIWEGSIEWGRKEKPLLLKIKTAAGITIVRELPNCDIKEGFEFLLGSLWQGETQVIQRHSVIERIGHRVVHGGVEFEQATLITGAVKEGIKKLIPLAPLHNPANLQGIEWMEVFFPSIPQIAVFDTSYHLTMPEIIKTYPVPLEWKEKGIQRYGFHGISHHYCAERAAQYLNRNPRELKMINCHLGNGCSLCAIKEGKSYETTMGFTPLEGLMMGTRCGSIDPGILLYQLREKEMNLQELDDVLTFSSGLKGIGGRSDMRELLGLQSEKNAKLAVQMFIQRLAFFIGALAVSLEGFHVLSFTAGIGENSAVIREEVCNKLSFLGLAIDFEKNKACRPDALISTAASSIQALVLHTREEWMIARTCFRFKLD